MANYERGVYEPPSDDIRVFDGGEDDMDEEGSRLPLLIVIALLVLAAFGGVVYLAYTQGVQRGRTDAPRMIAAAPGPAKTAPANPGGEATPYSGLKIYEQPAPADDESSDEEATPPPTPVTKSAAQPAMPVVKAPVENKQQVAAQTKPAPQKPAAPVKMATETPPAKIAEAPPAKAPVQSTVATAPPRSLTAKAPPAKAPPAKTQIAAATPAPATTSSSAGGAMLQIGAYKSEAEANAAWKSYETKHPIAGGYSPDVKQVDLADKGIWYRLRIGPFADKAAASAFCDKLKADGANCFLAK